MWLWVILSNLLIDTTCFTIKFVCNLWMRQLFCISFGFRSRLSLFWPKFGIGPVFNIDILFSNNEIISTRWIIMNLLNMLLKFVDIEIVLRTEVFEIFDFLDIFEVAQGVFPNSSWYVTYGTRVILDWILWILHWNSRICTRVPILSLGQNLAIQISSHVFLTCIWEFHLKFLLYHICIFVWTFGIHK